MLTVDANGLTMLAGDARHIPLADDTVQCCVTSPPYWGLRKYAGEQELVWGGTDACEHKWNESTRTADNRQTAGLSKDFDTRTSAGGKFKGKYDVICGVCGVCGGWRGAYGLEPTIEMYVAHTVEILREVRRVLRPDGVCWWNCGDSYNSQGGQHSGRTDNQRGVGQKRAWREGNGRADGATDLRGIRNQDGISAPGLTQPFTGWTKTSHRVRVEADAASDDTTRIASPDCPLHGDSSGSASSVACDEHASQTPLHSERSKNHHGPEQLNEHAQVDLRPSDCSQAESLDYSHLQAAGAATDRSKRSRRTGHAPVTSPACTLSAQSSSCTENSATARETSDSVDRKSESNTSADSSQDALGSSPSAQTQLRNAGKCTCEYYNTETKETSHFATFPEELPRRCILAATSAKGACLQCGAPWERVTRPSKQYAKLLAQKHSGAIYGKPDEVRQFSGATPSVSAADYQTVGWRPSCRCPGQYGRT
ncbi:MAG: DNA methyltransferase, partial [Candidatus Sulfotelmatobacter sp.]